MTAILRPIVPRWIHGSDPWGLTPMLITLSAIVDGTTPESRDVARGPPRPMARFRLELGPIPLHHQVYLDLRAALDAGEWNPGDRLPTERDLASRYGCSLITVRRALGELTREQRLERTRGRGTFVLHPRIDRDFAGELSFTEEMQLRGLDPATRLVAARPEVGRRGRRDRPGPGAGLADALPRATAPRRRRAPAPRAGPPAGRALPRAAGLGPGARLALRPADRTVRRADRTSARGPRTGPAPGP